MKNLLLIISLFSTIALFAQTSDKEPPVEEKIVTPEDALEYIKVANTLREAQQFERAEHFLRKALPVVEEHNRYWEASCYEGLGLVYRDQGISDLAIRNLRKALKIYKRLKNATSAKAITALLMGVEEKEEVYAGIEIGSKGVKMTVLGIWLTIEGYYDMDIKEDDSVNPNIVNMQDENIEKTIEAVNKYLAYIKRNYKLDDEHIFIVASSGVKLVAEQKQKLKELEQKLNEGIESENLKVDFIDAEQESYYVIKGTTLPRFRGSSSTMDIGSGNTKGGYLMGSHLDQIEAVDFDFGTETFSEVITSKKLERMMGYDTLAKVLGEEIVADQVNKKFKSKRGFETRRIVHLVGGIAWALVSYMHPDKVEQPFVPVSAADISEFKQRLIEEYDVLIQPNLEFITDEALRDKAQSEINRVTENFDREELIAGAIILNEISERYNQPTHNKRFVYARRGYIGWLTGYLMDHVTNQYAALNE